MAISAETLNVILKAKDNDFARQMKRNESRVARFSKTSNARLKGTTAHFKKLGGAAAAFLPALGAAAMVSAVKNVVSKLDDIGKTADRIGITTDALQELRAVAESAGVEQSALDNSIEKLSKGLAEAAMGSGTAKNALDELGLSANDLMALGLDGALAKIADEISKVPDPMQKTALATQLFGRSGAPMLNLLREGAAGMAKMRQEARDLGIVIDEDLIRNAEEAQTQLDLMSRVISAELSSALISLAPLLVASATSIAQLSSAAREFFSIGQFELPELLDAEGVRALAAEMGGLTNELASVERARDALSANEETFGIDSSRAVSWAETLAAAEENLAAAIARRQAAQAATQRLVTGLGDAAEQTDVLREQAELNAMSAAERERAAISTRRMAMEQAMLNDLIASGIDAQDETYQGIVLVADAYEAAEIAASKILNPVKAVAAAGAGAAASIESVVDVVAELSPMLSRLGMDAESFNGIMQTVENSMESAFMSMVDGTSTASEAFKSMASEIIKELYRVLVVKQITGFITDTISLATGQTGFFDGVAGAPVSGRASGGSVASGQGYMVGEHGPEPFIPAQNGRILSVAQSQAAMSGGGGGVTVIQNNTFGNGVNRAEINSMLPKIVEASKAAVLDAKRRGGSYGSAF